jgi:hypothetical protein
MNFNRELALKLVNTVFDMMPEDCQFGPVCGNDQTPTNFEMIYDEVKKVDEDADVHYGISKLVIISPHLGNYVIKVPFNGMYEENYDYKCTLDGGCPYSCGSCYHCEHSIEPDPNEYWCDYSNADSPTGWNYCDAEWKKYKNLRKIGLDCFVAKIYPFVEINGFKCFIQEIAVAENNTNGSETSRVTVASRKKAESLNNEFYCDLNEDWLGLCIEIFGAKKVRRFMEYARYTDHDILADMHSGNYGYRPNGTPCILDFASFDC